jgi:hypothetical protein
VTSSMVEMRITKFWVQSEDQRTWRMKAQPCKAAMLKKKAKYNIARWLDELVA